MTWVWPQIIMYNCKVSLKIKSSANIPEYHKTRPQASPSQSSFAVQEKNPCTGRRAMVGMHMSYRGVESLFQVLFRLRHSY